MATSPPSAKMLQSSRNSYYALYFSNVYPLCFWNVYEETPFDYLTIKTELYTHIYN